MPFNLAYLLYSSYAFLWCFKNLSFNLSLFITTELYYPLFKLGTKDIEILNNYFKKNIGKLVERVPKSAII